MCSVFSLAFGKGRLLATSSRSFVELQVLDNGVGDPAATLVVMGSVVGGREGGHALAGGCHQSP